MAVFFVSIRLFEMIWRFRHKGIEINEGGVDNEIRKRCIG